MQTYPVVLCLSSTALIWEETYSLLYRCPTGCFWDTFAFPCAGWILWLCIFNSWNFVLFVVQGVSNEWNFIDASRNLVLQFEFVYEILMNFTSKYEIWVKLSLKHSLVSRSQWNSRLHTYSCYKYTYTLAC